MPENKPVICQGVAFEPQAKDKLRCFFCGGPKCKRCSDSAYRQLESPALEKIHSSWITKSIIGMQRPSESIFQKADLINQFKKNNIVAIFNLTEPGEHPYCGYGQLGPSGFPYSPEKLMMAGSKIPLSK
jgi:hypothetical protein